MTQSVVASQSIRESFGKELTRLAQDYSFTVFDADVAGGTGMHHFRSKYPERFYQCGISEQAMVGAACGYALAKNEPVVASTFAVFGARAWEIYRLSAVYNKADVKLVLSHLGLDVGPDGASAQSLEHYAIWRSIPGLTVLQPACPQQAKRAAWAMLNVPGPMVVLTGRSQAPIVADYLPAPGDIDILKRGDDVAIFATGRTVAVALEAAELLRERLPSLSATVVNVPWLSPANKTSFESVFVHCRCAVTVEDHSLNGGLFGVVSEMASQTCPIPIEPIGVKDFGQSGEPDELYSAVGLTAQNIADRAVLAVMRRGSY